MRIQSKTLLVFVLPLLLAVAAAYFQWLHVPQEPKGFFHYNALQQLTYFSTIFVLAPWAIFHEASRCG